MDLTHYIFVRSDLPLGVLAAMVTHAAGESGALYQDPENGRFRGATAVVLEAKDEAALDKIEAMLFEANIQAVSIRESEPSPYAGQLMAIGVVPMDRARGNGLFWKYQTLKSCLDNRTVGSVSLGSSNETVQVTT